MNTGLHLKTVLVAAVLLVVVVVANLLVVVFCERGHGGGYVGEVFVQQVQVGYPVEELEGLVLKRAGKRIESAFGGAVGCNLPSSKSRCRPRRLGCNGPVMAPFCARRRSAKDVYKYCGTKLGDANFE